MSFSIILPYPIYSSELPHKKAQAKACGYELPSFQEGAGGGFNFLNLLVIELEKNVGGDIHPRYQ
jgi:hypothetical protein